MATPSTASYYGTAAHAAGTLTGGSNSALPHILVIDDEQGPRESLRFIFKKTYRVTCACSVDEGLEILRKDDIDTIILDIKMPGRTGIEGLSDIRAIDSQVSVIMLTGFGSLETAQKAIRLGANDYIKKPFDMIEIREAVSRHVDRTRAERQRTKTLNDLRALNQELEGARGNQDHLAQLGQASSEFVHDLRNPLTVICGYAQILKQELDGLGSAEHHKTDELKAYIEHIESSAVRCQEMSKVWRDLSRPEQAKREAINIEVLLREVVETAVPLESAARIELQLPTDTGCPIVTGDPLQLSRALQNLIGNALQALPETQNDGHVEISHSQDERDVMIAIRDNGCGIPEEFLTEIFKANVSTKGERGGMGLGLFITRQIADLHGGTVELHNRPEGGAEALLRLPLAGTRES